MTTLTLLGAATILPTTLATPVLAQALIQEPGAYAVYRSNGDLGIGSTPSQRPGVVVVGRGTADAVVWLLLCPLRLLTLRNIHGACRGKAISIASTRHRSSVGSIGHRRLRPESAFTFAGQAARFQRERYPPVQNLLSRMKWR
jgi:hypothetical protein